MPKNRSEDGVWDSKPNQGSSTSSAVPTVAALSGSGLGHRVRSLNWGPFESIPQKYCGTRVNRASLAPECRELPIGFRLRVVEVLLSESGLQGFTLSGVLGYRFSMVS